MQFRVHTALGASYQASTPPFLVHKLDAVRCALRYVASIGIVLLSGALAASPNMIRANTPMSLHRFQRLSSVLCGPYSLGASYQRNPLRLMKIMPLRTRRSATRGTRSQGSPLGKIRPKPDHPLFAQPIKIAHITPPQMTGLTHATMTASTRLMGPEANQYVKRKCEEACASAC